MCAPFKSHSGGVWQKTNNGDRQYKVSLQCWQLLPHRCRNEEGVGRGVKKTNLHACPATKTAIGDVPSCGKVWKLASGTAELTPEGNLEVEVKGLVLNDASTGDSNGTPDGVDGVAAAVVCHGVSGFKVGPQTDVVR